MFYVNKNIKFIKKFQLSWYLILKLRFHVVYWNKHKVTSFQHNTDYTNFVYGGDSLPIDFERSIDFVVYIRGS